METKKNGHEELHLEEKFRKGLIEWVMHSQLLEGLKCESKLKITKE
jgi:hypothetical protein